MTRTQPEAEDRIDQGAGPTPDGGWPEGAEPEKGALVLNGVADAVMDPGGPGSSPTKDRKQMPSAQVSVPEGSRCS